MTFFKVITPFTYWVLIVLWSFILYFYIKRLRIDLIKGRLFHSLLLILLIDAFRTLFESFYFGVRFTSLSGFLPIGVYSFLIRPEMVFIPKVLNVLSAIAIISILLLKWLPQETQRRKRLEQLVGSKTKELKKEIEERRQIEKEIKIHNENLNIIFNSTPNILVLLNKDGRVEDINHKGVKFSGKIKASLLGSLIGKVFNCLNSFDGKGCGLNPDCSKCPIQTRVMDTLETGKSHTDKEGQITFLINGIETSMNFLISTTLLHINGMNKVLLSLTDITEKKKQEKALLISEEKFRLSFQTSPDSINLNRLEDGLYLEINEGFTQIMGYPREEVIGKTSIELNIWKNSNDRKRLVNTLREKGYVENLEAEFIGKGGRIIDGLMSARILKINNKDVIISIARDNTERKKAERELKTSEEQHKSILETAMDGFWLVDTSGRLLEINQTYCQMSGYTYEELLGMNISGLEAKELKYQTIERMNRLILKGQDRFESKHRRKDGSVFDIEMSVQYRKNDGGKCVCFLRDLTEQKRFAEQLQQAQKMEAIGTLAGGIAHDFNNILFPIVGYTEMMLEDVPEDSPLRSSLAEIYTGSMRARDLVQQILTFSRQESGELQLMKMQPIIKEALKLLRSSIPAIIEIKQEIQPNCGPVKADPTKIHQIVMNLVTNAYHAMEKTGGKIDVKVQEVTLEGNEWAGEILKPGEYALLSVSDTGCGIPQSHMTKIFEPYFTTKGRNKGTGLGLSIIYGIVKEYKGDIHVYSEVGKGTTFNIYLPLIKKISSPAPTEIQKIIPTGTERILLVDDEISIMNLQKQVLERLGYKITERSSSAEALGAFKANPDNFDLVITDMSMPHMNGNTLAKELTSIRSDIPIIICTGFSESVDQLISKRIGVKGFLMKPIIQLEMATMVRRVLDGMET